MTEELSLFESVNKQKKESFHKWFNRWFERMEFEDKIKKSAMKGYSYLVISISDLSTEQTYLKRRLRDKQTVILLQKNLPDFSIEYKEEQGDRMLLNAKIGTWEKDYISIYW